MSAMQPGWGGEGAKPWAVGLALATGGLTFAAGLAVPGWHRDPGLLLSILAATLAVWGIQRMLVPNTRLVAAQEENRRLVVSEERTRFAGDLHDILGHSLTVITVKAELAQRLLDLDPDRARAELADLERLSRDALTAVRRIQAGLRVVDPALAPDSLVTGDSPLTSRETEVLQVAHDGSSVASIAGKVNLSEGTVRNHLSAAIGKTQAANRAEAVVIAQSYGWL